MYVSVGAPGTTFSSTGASGATAADSLTSAANYASEMLTRSVMEYVYQSYPEIKNHGYTADDLLANVAPVASTTSPTISITATAPNASDGVLLANAVANGFQSYVTSQLQSHLDLLRQNIQDQLTTYQKQSTDLENKIQQLNNLQDPRTALWTTDRSDTIHNIDSLNNQLQSLPTTIHSDVYVIQQAKNSDASPTAKASTIVAASAGVGLLLGLAIMLLMIFLDSRLRSEEHVKEKLGLAYIGSLATEKELGSAPTRVSGASAQQVGDISANLRLTGVLAGQWQAPHGAVLLITSPQSAEGKTTLAASLAATFARGGGSGIVVDGNLRRPSTHLAFGMSPSGIGLSGLLKGNGQSVDEAVVRSNIPGIWLLPGGAALNESAFLLSQKMPTILAHLRSKTDLVIVDGPSLLNGADASLLASMADGVALVVDVRHEKLPQLLRARDLLKSLAHAPTGVVMNRFTRRSRKGNNYYATAFPVDADKNSRVPVELDEISSNGHGKEARNGNGHLVEERVAPPSQVDWKATVPSSPSRPGPSSWAPLSEMSSLPPVANPMPNQQIPGSPRPNSIWSPYQNTLPPFLPGKDE
jgi:capsular exopolysaccharide synthesis family protein